jgi:tetratricopeptide (TPR) repeat protein
MNRTLQFAIAFIRSKFSPPPTSADDPRLRLDHAVFLLETGRIQNALRLLSASIASPDTPSELKAKAWLLRSSIYENTGQPHKALADLSAIIETPGASPENLADAQINRACLRGRTGDWPGAIADCTAVATQEDAHPRQRLNALHNRSLAYKESGDATHALEDLAAILAQTDIFPKTAIPAATEATNATPPTNSAQQLAPHVTAAFRAFAFNNRHLVHLAQEDTQAALADLEELNTIPDPLPPDLRAEALLSHGRILAHDGLWRRALADFSAVLALPEASPQYRADALALRGDTLRELGEPHRADADYAILFRCTQAWNIANFFRFPRILFPILVFVAAGAGGISAILGGDVWKMNKTEIIAAFSKGRTAKNKNMDRELEAIQEAYKQGTSFSVLGEHAKALEKFTQVVNFPNVTGNFKVEALAKCANARAQLGDAAGAIADWTTMLNLPESSREWKNYALYVRGKLHMQNGEKNQMKSDFEILLARSDVSPDVRGQVLSLRAEAYRLEGNWKKMLADYAELIDTPSIPADARTATLFARARHYKSANELPKAIADYTEVTTFSGATPTQKTLAFTERGMLFREKFFDNPKALADYNSAVAIKGVESSVRLSALSVLGQYHVQLGNYKEAEEVLTTALTVWDGGAEMLRAARGQRALARGAAGLHEAAIADWTVLVNTPGLPLDAQIFFLSHRRDAYRQLGDAPKALDDERTLLALSAVRK